MEQGERRRPFFKAVMLLVGAALVILLLSIFCIPYFQKLAEPETQRQLEQWIGGLGFEGWLIVLAVQMLQIIVAFVPGEPVELLAGVLYGTWGGLLTCLLGIALASSIVFFTVRRFGYPLVSRIFGEKRLAKFRFLNDAERAENLTFILFLIPGVPKDMLTYLAGVSRIGPASFLLISTFARIPSVITSTMMGASVSQGNFGASIAAFLLTAAIGAAGLLFKDKLLHQLHKMHRPGKGGKAE